MSQELFFLNNINKHSDDTTRENTDLALGTNEERAALLRAGFTGKAIELQYLKLNGIIVVGVSWQDGT